MARVAAWMVYVKADDAFLPDYAGRYVGQVQEKVLEVARKEGYYGGIDQRLLELGWTIVPVYAGVAHGG